MRPSVHDVETFDDEKLEALVEMMFLAASADGDRVRWKL